MNQKIFSRLGLEEKETMVYLALLKLGKTTVEKIKKETKIERTHIYKILERLIDKNFVTSIIENKTKHFIPNPPKDLIIELHKTTKELSQLLPELENLSKQKEKEETQIKIYRGKEGMEKAGEELILSTKEYIVFGEQAQLQQTLPIYSAQFMKKLEENNIKERVLVKEGIKTIKSKNSIIRFLPKEFDFPTSIVVYNALTNIIIWSEPLIITIENKEVAKSYKNYFELLWKIAKS